MKLIPLTQDQFAKVDDEDYPRLVKWKWYAKWDPYTKSFYALRHAQHKIVSMAREIMKAKPGEIVDHIHHNTLDNQKSELRICTATESSANRRRQSNNKSGVVGVLWRPRLKRWEAAISYQGKHIHLGYFKSKEDAIEARRIEAEALFGGLTGTRYCKETH